ncbi:LytTR family DNA-binding domain-containing protein [Chryseobacterium sp. sg2396]|uniref:LytR/AlgR family response regulator transcription factor n=1 Tax=Chryseobacterium sp. sg2396 TaxID=3276280 RepID=UPI0025F5638E|nr:LytTR family DNA-binding domain-containing protein [uncultured Chryseobacterium sp.]
MTKILIIEDEIPARKKLRRFIEELETPVHIMAELDTVQAAVTFLKNHQPDLIFSDIELLDGNAFEIYSEVHVACPVIFTTAYDHFWMDAFDTNGIAYLLKPFSRERFQKAWDKYTLLTKSPLQKKTSLDDLAHLIRQNISGTRYKKRFGISSPQGMYFLETAEIAFFEADEGMVSIHDRNGKRHLLSGFSLKELEEQLNPEDFFRINRSELVHKIYVENVQRYNKNILAVKVTGCTDLLKTSQATTAAFRDWVER